jgi:hypothetical protein
MSPEGPNDKPQDMITNVPGVKPSQLDPNVIKAGENIPLAPDSPAAVAFQASAQRAAENGAVVPEFVMPEGADLSVPELPAVGTPDKVLDGSRDTGSYTTPEGVTSVSEVTGDGMKQTRIVSGAGDQQTYNADAAKVLERAAAHREAMANADPEYLKQFMPPEGTTTDSIVPPLPKRPALIDSVPGVDHDAVMAEVEAERAAKAEADKRMPTHGGYTGPRISQMPGAVDALGRPTGPIVRPPEQDGPK